MSFKISCPHCSKTLNAPEDALGKVLPCPVCKQPVTIPQHSELFSPLSSVMCTPRQCMLCRPKQGRLYRCHLECHQCRKSARNLLRPRAPPTCWPDTAVRPSRGSVGIKESLTCALEAPAKKRGLALNLDMK